MARSYPSEVMKGKRLPSQVRSNWSLFRRVSSWQTFERSSKYCRPHSASEILTFTSSAADAPSAPSKLRWTRNFMVGISQNENSWPDFFLKKKRSYFSSTRERNMLAAGFDPKIRPTVKTNISNVWDHLNWWPKKKKKELMITVRISTLYYQ